MMDDAKTLRMRLAGSLYGLLVGDALGCPVEQWAPERIQKTYGVLRSMVEPRGRWRPAGLHSDDGQQALALSDGILEDPERPEQGLARILVEMGRTEEGGHWSHRGTGRNFRGTMAVLSAGGGLWDGAQPSSGNGVAMMIAPAAWYWRDDEEQLATRVASIARVKQNDLRGIASAAAVAYLVAHGLNHGGFATVSADAYLHFVESVEQRAAQALRTDQHVGTFSHALGDMLGDLGLDREPALFRIAVRANATADHRCYPGSGYALASVVTSCYVALTSSAYEQAVVDTINLGGDADTTGAMVGAICGAAYGQDAIPREWYAALRARDCFDDRVEALVARRTPWTPAVPLARLERAWTDEYEARRKDGGQ
jgi:ADP-ribosylglycohydrolase